MLLAIDIGNTNIAVGLYDGQMLLDSWSISADKSKTADEYGISLFNFLNLKFNSQKIDSAVISSVVLPLTEKFREGIEKYFNARVFVVTSKTQTGVTLDVENPKEVGSDRIANVCAAYNLYGAPAVVVDFGTATNFDVIAPEGRFLGGIIAPGLRSSAETFSAFTNRLPKLEIEDTSRIIGKNTIQNMLSGVVIGHASMIDGLISRIESELQAPVITIATGGFSSAVTRHMIRPFDHLNKNLTLEGLRIIYDLNKYMVAKS